MDDIDIIDLELAISIIKNYETIANQRNDATAGNAWCNDLRILDLVKTKSTKELESIKIDSEKCVW